MQRSLLLGNAHFFATRSDKSLDMLVKINQRKYYLLRDFNKKKKKKSIMYMMIQNQMRPRYECV